MIDYVRDDFTRRPERYELILENAGNHLAPALRRRLNPGGMLAYSSGASMRRMAVAMLLSRVAQDVSTFLTTINHDDLMVLRDMVASGRLRPVVDRVYPLAETLAAIAYVEAGNAQERWSSPSSNSHRGNRARRTTFGRRLTVVEEEARVVSAAFTVRNKASSVNGRHMRG